MLTNDDLFTSANSSITYPESNEHDDSSRQNKTYDGVTIRDVSDEEDSGGELEEEIELYLKEETNGDDILSSDVPNENVDQSKMDTQLTSERNVEKNQIYANGNIFAELIITNSIKSNLRTMKESIKAIKQILEDIYDEFSTSTNSNSAHNKNRRTFDANKKRVTDELVRRLEESHKKTATYFQSIEDKNYKMLEESDRKYYLEPRQTHAGSGGNGMKHSLNNPPTNASVFFTPEEAMTYIDSSTGSISSSVASTADF